MVVPLEIPGAHYVGNQACLDCHAEIVREFPASPHARVHFENAAMAGETGCESCHGPGSKHIESGGNAKFIINPGKDPASCFQCHLDVQAEFNLPQHHPVIEGHMSCVQCHDPHGGDIFKPAGGLAMARQNESCAQCHREQTRPVCFRARGHARRLHGLPQPARLDQPEDARRERPESLPALPRAGADRRDVRRHIYIGNTDHTQFLQMGTCWTAGCHTAIHGSNVDPRLRY